MYGTFFAAHLQRQGLDARRPVAVVTGGPARHGSGLLGGALADRLGPSRVLVVMFTLQGIAMVLLALGQGIWWYAASALLYGVSLWASPRP